MEWKKAKQQVGLPGSVRQIVGTPAFIGERVGFIRRVGLKAR